MMADEQIKQTVREQFSRNAGNYVNSEGHARGDDLSLMIEWLRPEPSWTVLDVATGGGHVAKSLAPHVGHVLATDLTPDMLATARSFLDQFGFTNMVYVVADAEALPFLAESFDLVTCRIAPHHFPNPDRFVSETARVLRPGGRFLLIDNVAPEDPEMDRFMNTAEMLRDPSHVRCPRVSEWRAWLAAAGLTEVRTVDRRKMHRFPGWVERIGSSPEQRQMVEEHILGAPPPVRQYFDVTLGDDGLLASFRVDEWMALYAK